MQVHVDHVDIKDRALERAFNKLNEAEQLIHIGFDNWPSDPDAQYSSDAEWFLGLQTDPKSGKTLILLFYLTKDNGKVIARAVEESLINVPFVIVMAAIEKLPNPLLKLRVDEALYDAASTVSRRQRAIASWQDCIH